MWRRVGLCINETVMLDIRDWRPDLGEFGKIHVRELLGHERIAYQLTKDGHEQ